MSKTYAIRKRSRGGIKGFQVVWFNLPTYFTNNGYAADEHDVKDGWFEYVDGAVSLAHDLSIAKLGIDGKLKTKPREDRK